MRKWGDLTPPQSVASGKEPIDSEILAEILTLAQEIGFHRDPDGIGNAMYLCPVMSLADKVVLAAFRAMDHETAIPRLTGPA